MFARKLCAAVAIVLVWYITFNVTRLICDGIRCYIWYHQIEKQTPVNYRLLNKPIQVQHPDREIWI